MRPIDADAFHESIFQRYCKNCNSQAHRMCHACWVMDMMDELEEAPTINPEDLRPKGKWETYPNEFYLRCSVCRKEFYIGHFPLTKNYCPSCGAKMEE